MRKKKETKKYVPKNEFRYNNSPLARGHIHHVFGQKNDKFKSFGLTHNPREEEPYTKLSKNPNLKDKSDSYIEHRVHTAKQKYYGEPLPDYKFCKDDMSIVRSLKKRYKIAAYSRKKNKKKR